MTGKAEVILDQESQHHDASSPNGGLAPQDEPNTIGTLFILIVFLMALAGLWGIMYFTLLGR